MNEFNPYQSPAVEAEIISSPYEAGAFSGHGIWRKNDKLIMNKSAQLPNICVKTNRPAERRVKKTLSWHPPALILLILVGVLVYVIVALVMTKKAKIEIPVTNQWMAIRRKRILNSVGVLLLGIVLFVAAVFAIASELPDGVIVTLFISSIGLGIAGLIAWVMAARILWPSRITDTHVHLSGVHRDLLAQYPAWPSD